MALVLSTSPCPPDFFRPGSPKGDTERTVAAIFMTKLGAYPPLEGVGGGSTRLVLQNNLIYNVFTFGLLNNYMII